MNFGNYARTGDGRGSIKTSSHVDINRDHTVIVVGLPTVNHSTVESLRNKMLIPKVFNGLDLSDYEANASSG